MPNISNTLSQLHSINPSRKISLPSRKHPGNTEKQIGKNCLNDSFFREASPKTNLLEKFFCNNYSHAKKTGLLCCSLLLCASTQAASVFINEFHYDNNGTDIDEGVEIAGIAGTNLEEWQLLFYNGLNGRIYRDEVLHGVIPDESLGFGTLSFNFPGIQNGPADAFALIDGSEHVIEFISYEGSVLATEGLAQGMNSIDTGVAEASDSLPGFSIQRIGTGTDSNDFTWTYHNNSFGSINTNQSFNTSAVPLPAASWFMSSGLLSLVLRRKLADKSLEGSKRVIRSCNRATHHQVVTAST